MNHERILIVRLSAIGDTIHALPLVSALKKQSGKAFVGWVVEKKASAFIENNPLVDKAYILKNKSFSEYLRVIKEIRQDGYDIAIDVQGLLKSAILMFFSGAKRRIGFDKSREFSYLLANERVYAGEEFDPNVHIIDRNLKIAEYLGVTSSDVEYPLPKCDVDIWDKYLQNFDKDEPLVVLSPATTWETKHWGEGSWSKLLDGLSDRQVVFTGGKQDVSLIERIIANSENKNAVVLAGKTNLLELAEVFKCASVVVSPDSGSAHIAVAAKHPKVICLVGPTSENRNGAYSSQGQVHINLIKNVNCRPCYKKKCPKTGNNKECMLNIDFDTVLFGINRILIDG